MIKFPDATQVFHKEINPRTRGRNNSFEEKPRNSNQKKKVLPPLPPFLFHSCGDNIGNNSCNNQTVDNT